MVDKVHCCDYPQDAIFVEEIEIDFMASILIEDGSKKARVYLDAPGLRNLAKYAKQRARELEARRREVK